MSLSPGRVFLEIGQQGKCLERSHVIRIDRREALAQPIVQLRLMKQSKLLLRVGRRAADGWAPAARELIALEGRPGSRGHGP